MVSWFRQGAATPGILTCIPGFVTQTHSQAKDKSRVPRFLLPVYPIYTALSSCAQRLGDASVRSTINAKTLAYG